jgi:hypothetical protein
MSVSSIFNSGDEVVTDITKSICHARKCAKDYDMAVENMQSKKKQLAQIQAEYRTAVDNVKHLFNLKNMADKNVNKKCADNLPGFTDFRNNAATPYSFSSSAGSIQYDNHEEDGARGDNQSFRLWEDQSDLRNYYVSGNSNTTNNTANTSLLSSR